MMKQHLRRRRAPLGGPVNVVAYLLGIGLLVGCAETQLGAQALKTAVRAEQAAVAAPERGDPSLAPDDFEARGVTIWDGVTTLQGVWLAHPLASRARRVRVVNEENGFATEGALFRRDPALTGPSILVSSDAALALGLEAGAPTELHIVALTDETRVAAAPAGEAATPGEPRNALTPAEEQGEDEAGATVETAALAAPGGAPDDAPADAPADAANASFATEASGAETAGVGADEGAPPVATGADRPGQATTGTQIAAVGERRQISLTQRRTAPEPVAEEPAPVARTTVEEPTETAAATPAETGAEPAGRTKPSPRPEARRTVVAAAPPPAPAARPRAAAATPAPTPAADRKTAPRTGLAAGNYVQVGSFRRAANANALADRLKLRGLPAQIVRQTISGGRYSVVMVGPLADDAARRAVESAAAEEGLNDTIKVTL